MRVVTGRDKVTFTCMLQLCQLSLVSSYRQVYECNATRLGMAQVLLGSRFHGGSTSLPSAGKYSH